MPSRENNECKDPETEVFLDYSSNMYVCQCV